MAKIYFGYRRYEYSGEENLSGPFGDELIAGGFITKIFFIHFFYFTSFLQKNFKDFF